MSVPYNSHSDMTNHPLLHRDVDLIFAAFAQFSHSRSFDALHIHPASQSTPPRKNIRPCNEGPQRELNQAFDHLTGFGVLERQVA
jgi:hypothetical protein